MRAMSLNPPQAEYFQEPFRELSWKQRAFFVAHMGVGITLILLVFGAPFYGTWAILKNDVISGSLTVAAGLLIWVMFALLNRM